ncbi:PREDICTED: tetratricopeptide repeat protein 21A isoform X6 [Hipposideros armiger]|uniref:Tetratricopeptide repeat protein 21A isoform X6 n=1 Tax=Hipposideros armiger TaxID=186990 RepID=A0A8B7T2A3_HIPAR|nr:PREDICTED: tetratricopeptide repeat protein 21A isoform X6 [Hipposideros armiger]
MAEARLPRQGPEPRGGPSHTLAPASPLGARLPAPCHVGASLLPPLTLTPLTTGQQLRFQGRARLQLPAARGVPRTLTRESSLARPHQTGSRSRESPEMSSNDSSLMAGIIYYSQEKYFRHVQQAAAVGLEKFSNDSVLQFFKAYGVFREERIQDAISNLESIRSHPDVSLCSTMALIYAHKSCETIDQEAIQELQSSLKETRKKASGTALYYASLFLWLMGHHDRAREYIDCVLRLSSTSSEAYVLRGWVDLTSDKPHTVKKSIKYLEQGTQDAQDVLGLMGKATYYMTQQNYSGALEVVNQITVASGGFLPALVLKMRLFLARQDWEQTIEIGLRILEKDKSNIDACQILAMHELAREGNMTTAADHVRNLIKALEIREPQNPSLHLKKILVVSRLCGRNQVILRLVCSFIERTFMATPLYAHMATELGYLFILQDQVKEASLWYSEAMKLDDSSVAALTGELENAQSTLQRCLELDPTSADAHLLMSQIYLAQGNFSMCSHCLELGVSHNFQVRDHPLYHFIKARALNKSGDYPEAIKTLQMIIKLPTLRMEESKKLRGPSMQPSERVSILLELVDALRMNGELHEATKVMQDAINEFSGTPEEIRITIANVDLALSKGNVDMALSVLRNITPQQPCYTEAKEKMASIYLHTRKDSRLYIGCYRELCEHLPGPHTSLLLGDAFINIQEPEKALEVYDEAYRKNPHDASLVSRIGQAYVKTHQYLKAMNYYEAAQKISGQDFLCCDLAELLLKLKKFIKAEKVLTQALEHDFVKDIPSMMNDVKCLLLLAKVYKSHKKQDVLETLNKARDLQSRILKRVPMEQPEMIASQKQLAASICIQFGEHYLEEKDYAKAVRSYKDALSYSPTDNKVMLELAQLYLLQGHLDLCEQHCAILLQTEKNHEIASMMMADLMFRKQEYEAAVHLYHQILEKAPDNFRILNKLIDLLRRSGKLEDAPAYFELAKKLSSRVLLEPGFNYCTGIYCWHIGHPKEAMKFLNKARKDSTWGQSATYYMVQICLNPDNEIVGGKAFENLVSESNSPGRKESEQQEGVRTAEKLLLEFYPHTAWGQTQLQLLQGLCLLATREKANVEAALGTFINMAQAEKDSVPALLAVAQAYMLLKQIPKARTQLKRLAKAPWALAEAEDLEKSWLLLADIYCQGGKFDLATELLRRCVQYNKSCCKAYEYMGFIMEKEQSYKDAATNYELAWKYSHHANPAIGFKLAFNYLKDKRFVEAIDVCHHVLGEHPNYPKIREEILEKAQGSLRP